MSLGQGELTAEIGRRLPIRLVASDVVHPGMDSHEIAPGQQVPQGCLVHPAPSFREQVLRRLPVGMLGAKKAYLGRHAPEVVLGREVAQGAEVDRIDVRDPFVRRCGCRGPRRVQHEGRGGSSELRKTFRCRDGPSRFRFGRPRDVEQRRRGCPGRCGRGVRLRADRHRDAEHRAGEEERALQRHRGYLSRMAKMDRSRSVSG